MSVKRGKGKGKGKVRDDRGKRLLDLVVALLGARAPVPYREIRQQFRAYFTDNDEAGLRAFERDKAELLELGVPLRYVTPEEDDSVEEAGYIVDLRRYRLPEIRLTAEEAASLYLAGAMARAAPGTTYAAVVDLALKKLAFDLPASPDTPGIAPRPAAGAETAAPRARGLGGSSARGHGEPVLVHFPRPADERLTERLALLEEATRYRKRITLDYVTARSGEAVSREVDPYGLVYRQGAWLLVGHCHLRGSVRSFRLDRMRTVTVAPKPKSPDFERPAGFDARRYADRSPWTYESEAPVDVELEVRPQAAAVANEDFGDRTTREPVGDGGICIRFACTNPDYLVARVMAAKGALVVRGPEPMRRRARDELEAVAALYAEPGAVSR